MKQQPFLRRTRILRRKPRTDGLARIIEQEGIFERLLRKNVFSQSREEYNFKRKPGQLRGCGYENFSIAPLRRIRAKKRQAMLEDLTNFIKTDRTQTGHRLQLIQHRQNELRPANTQDGQFAQYREPLVPVRTLRQLI